MTDQGINFFGKITASATHEFINILATIRETSGLIEDLLSLRPVDDSGDERFAGILKKIKEQTERGVSICEKLNAFSHSIDEPRSRILIGGLLDQVVFLMQGICRLQRVYLIRDSAHQIEPPTAIISNSFRLQLALASCIETCLAGALPEERIRVQTELAGERIAIRFVIDTNGSRSPQKLEIPGRFGELNPILNDLEAQLTHLDKPGQSGLTLSLPISSTDNTHE